MIDAELPFWKRSLLSLPALLMMGLTIALASRALIKRKSIEDRYRAKARHSIAAKNFKQAKFYYMRLISAGNQGTLQDQLNWATILAGSGDQASSIHLLKELAPVNAVGFGPAHLIKAKMLATQLNAESGLTNEKLKELAWHLKGSGQKNSREVHILWANYFLAVQRTDKALEHFEAAASIDPDLWFSLGSLYGQLGRHDAVAVAMKRASEHAQEKLAANPLDVEYRIRLLHIFAAQKNYAQLEPLVSEGLRLGGNDPRLRVVASDLALAQMAEVKDEDTEAVTKRLALLSRAAQLSPSNPQVFKAINSYYQKSESEAQRAQLRDQLEEWIVQGRSLPIAHFALGNLLWQETNSEGAVFHYETALQLDPSLAFIANNLAWVLTHTNPPDLNRAEKLAEMATQQDPKNPSFWDTMGMVRLKQERYAEALPLLEKVLPQANEDKKKEIHLHLATIYDHLGRESLAKRHREVAGRVGQ